jgi:hypothetical protein
MSDRVDTVEKLLAGEQGGSVAIISSRAMRVFGLSLS